MREPHPDNFSVDPDPSARIQNAQVITFPTEKAVSAEDMRMQSRQAQGEKIVHAQNLDFGQREALRVIGHSAVHEYALYMKKRAERPSRLKRFAAATAFRATPNH